MRLFLLIGLCVFVGGISSSHAQNHRDDLYKQCIDYNRTDRFCQCAIDKPYDALVDRDRKNASGGLTYQLEKAEERYQAAYQHELKVGKLTPAQLGQACQVIGEYYDFLGSIGIDYKKSVQYLGHKKAMGNLYHIPQDKRSIVTLKRTEYRKTLHELNLEFQRGGAFSILSDFRRGTCFYELQVKWLKEYLAQQKPETDNTPSFDIRSLIGAAARTCHM